MRRKIPVALLLAGWLAALAVGWLLFTLRSAPGAANAAPPRWPDGATLEHGGRPAVLLFAHPHCPCTRRGLQALESVLARSPSAADVWVVFVLPPDAPADWERGESWRLAQAVAGARLVVDHDATIARRFGAETSGQVLAYWGDGTLAFQGGITAPHDNANNPGRRALTAALRDERAEAVSRTPVFGCPLYEE